VRVRVRGDPRVRTADAAHDGCPSTASPRVRARG
jgi:hypothetical protein